MQSSNIQRGCVAKTRGVMINSALFVYRAVDSEGNTIEFLLSPTRDAEAAIRFFLKALHATVDGASQAHPVEKQVAQHATAANPATSIPRVVKERGFSLLFFPTLLILFSKEESGVYAWGS
jgi:hypothetical protein